MNISDGSGHTLIGFNLWKDDTVIECSDEEYNDMYTSMKRRCTKIEGVLYFKVKKGFLMPLTPKLVHQTLYGVSMKNKFTSGITGFHDLLNEIRKEGSKGYITSLDGRRIQKQSDHSLLNYKLQSSGKVITAYWVFYIYENLRANGLVMGKDYFPMGIIHDEVAIASLNKVTDSIVKVMYKAMNQANSALKMVTPLQIDHFVGKDWTEH